MTPKERKELRNEFFCDFYYPEGMMTNDPDKIFNWLLSKLTSKNAEIEGLKKELKSSRELNNKYYKDSLNQLEELASVEAYYASHGLGRYPQTLKDKDAEIRNLKERLKVIMKIVEDNKHQLW